MSLVERKCLRLSNLSKFKENLAGIRQSDKLFSCEEPEEGQRNKALTKIFPLRDEVRVGGRERELRASLFEMFPSTGCHC